MNTLLTTLIHRPYVFLFLAAFLFLGTKHMGLIKTIIWLLIGYVIAFASEYSSIHNGFPYGEYHYLYDNMKGELILAGVPVWDSVSYAFMSYAGYSVALFAAPMAKTWKIWLLGATFTMILDIITDPVAKLGRQWFLGEIYYYTHASAYFNVPWTNFAGWFLVALLIIGANLVAFQALGSGKAKTNPTWLHVFFYISICLFNTFIAFFIQAFLLGAINFIITLLIVALITQKRRAFIKASAKS